MKSVDLKGAARENVGSKDAKALRAQELVPCVLYGLENPVHFSTSVNSFKKLVYTPDAYLVNLDIDGTAYTAILQDAQFHPLTEKILHADFLLAPEDKPVTVQLPVVTTGNSKGVIAGGNLSVVLRKLKVKGLAKDLPEAITIDMTDVGLGESVQVKSLDAIEGVEIINVPNAVIAAVKTTRTSRMGGDDLGEDEEGAEEAATEEAAAAE